LRFLLDQDVYHLTAAFLRSLGHDVMTAGEAGLSRAADDEILRAARSLDRILVTRDKGYGALLFETGQESAGAILLRMDPKTMDVVHGELARCFQEHSGLDWSNAFIVIEPSRHRLRRIS
jgi:predicted nuclease of predicted toxin-antitoxin system